MNERTNYALRYQKQSELDVAQRRQDKNLRAAFQRLDVDGGGTIGSEEMRGFLDFAEVDMSDNDKEAIFALVDKDASGDLVRSIENNFQLS